MRRSELLIIVVGVIVLTIIIGIYVVRLFNAPQQNPAIHERIASLDPTCTQLLYSLGLGKHVVVMDEYSAQLLSYFNKTPGNNVTILQSIWPFPSLESILSSAPTDICYDYGWYGPQLSKLAGYNWTIVIINGTSDSNMSQIDNDILKAGEELGAYSNAREVVSRINAILTGINSTTASLARPTVMYLDGINPIYSASFNTFIGYEIRAANGIDVVNTTYPWPQLSVSQFLLYNADYIIASDFMGNCSATLQAILSLPGVNSINAIRENHVFIIGNLGQSLVEEPGPLSVYGVKLIAYIIHPQAFGVNPPHCINATWIMDNIRPEMSIG